MLDRIDLTVIGSASLTLAVRIVLFGLALATNIILARSLGPAGRGVYAIAVLVPSIITLLAGLGLGQANIYHVSRGSLDKRLVVASSLAAAVVVGLAAYGLLVVAVLAWGHPTLMGVEPRFLLLGGLTLPFTLATASMQGVLHGEKRFVQLNAVLLSQSISLVLFLVILLFVPGDRIAAAIGAWTASSILSGLLAVALVGQHTPISFGIHLPTMRAMLRYGSLTYLGTLTSFVNYRFDLLLVNFFSGPAQAGLYAVGAGVAEVIWFLPNSLYIALAPRVAAAPEDESAKLSAQATRSIVILSAASALLLAAVAQFAIFVFFGSAFADSVVAVWLLLPGIVTFSAWKIMSCYLLGRNLLVQDLVAATAAMVGTLVLDLLLIPKYGFRGAAVASSIAYTIAMLVDLYWVLKRSGLPPTAWLIAVPADSQPVRERVRVIGNPASTLNWTASAKNLDGLLFSRLQHQYINEFSRLLVGCESILDVGCGANSPLEQLPARVAYSVGVDLFEPWIEKSKERRIHDEYVVADAVCLGEHFASRSFDCVLAMDLLEHLAKEDGFRVLEQMENIARKKVVILTPNGFIEQHETDMNPLQVHRSGWTAREMRDLGYSVTGVNGWRPLRGEYAKAKWRPRALWSRVSLVSQSLTTSRPELAFALLCVKPIGPR